MNTRSQIAMLMLGLAVALAGTARADDTTPADPADKTPATKPADEELSLDKILDDLDENMTREEIEAMLKRANENRLKSERQLVAGEMKSKMPDPMALDEALVILDKGAINTQQDNIERICKAYAKIDRKFGNLYKLYAAKQYAKGVSAGKELVNTESTFLSAARAYIYARCLQEAKPHEEDAADAYSDLLENMYDRISFASEAAMRRAALYEELGRGGYAMQAYAFVLKNYGLTLDQKEFDTIYDKIKKLQEKYGDPLGTIAKMMGDVKERLAKSDSGDQTRQTQKEIVVMLNDLIKTAEDQQSQGSGEGKPTPKKKKPSDGKPCEKCGSGQCDGQCNGKGKGLGKGTNNPSSPATESGLRGGDTTRATKLAGIHSSKENGDWSSMPPEKKEQLETLRNRLVGERHREIISEYKRRIAEGDEN